MYSFLFCKKGITDSLSQEKALRMELADRRTKQFIEENIPSYVSDIFHVDKEILMESHSFSFQLLRFSPLRQLFSLLSQSLHVFQFPCLNKHISLVLLDIILPEIFPSPQMNIPNPLENTLDTPERDL